MKILRIVLLAAIALAFVGCARVTTTTSIKADGSFSRKVVYTISKGGPMGGAGKTDKPEDMFKMPGDAGVKVTRTDDDKATVVTAIREVAADAAPLQDIAILTAAGKVLATSTVKVKKLSDGKLEYTETLHALTASQKAQVTIPQLREIVKKALPEQYQKTETIDRTTHVVFLNVCHVLLGPPEPYVFYLVTNQDAASHRFSEAIFNANLKTFKDTLPGIGDEAVRKLARDLTTGLNQTLQDQTSQAGSKENSDPNAMTPLCFSVSFPGKVVESNGIEDPVTGEVYWSLLVAALDLGDVELRVVVQP